MHCSQEFVQSKILCTRKITEFTGKKVLIRQEIGISTNVVVCTDSKAAIDHSKRLGQKCAGNVASKDAL